MHNLLVMCINQDNHHEGINMADLSWQHLFLLSQYFRGYLPKSRLFPTTTAAMTLTQPPNYHHVDHQIHDAGGDMDGAIKDEFWRENRPHHQVPPL